MKLFYTQIDIVKDRDINKRVIGYLYFVVHNGYLGLVLRISNDPNISPFIEPDGPFK